MVSPSDITDTSRVSAFVPPAGHLQASGHDPGQGPNDDLPRIVPRRHVGRWLTAAAALLAEAAQALGIGRRRTLRRIVIPQAKLRVARETADDLATDAVAREQAGKAPFDEVSQLRESGLLTLLIPAEFGGGGSDWPTAYAVVREVAAADGAIGQLLGCHYFLSWSARFFTEPSLATHVEQRSAAEQWCWGGGLARQESPLTLARTAGGFVLDGRQSYATGVLVADRLAVRAVRADTGEPLAVVVEPAHHGVGIDGDAGRSHDAR